MKNTFRIGVISDTHGLLRPEALSALQGVDLILHAGDIGSAEIIETLAEIAPVKAVRGNVDKEPWAQQFPLTETVDAGGIWIYMLHDLGQLDLDPAEAGFAAVVSGHSHQPLIEIREGVLYVNPGAAGKKRFSLPISLGFIEICGNSLHSDWIEIVQ